MSKPKPKKSLGQHFFCEPELLDYYVSEMGLVQEDVVLEIGPGTGALTELLLPRVKQVVAVEMDRQLAQQLNHRWLDTPSFSLIQADIMAYPLTNLVPLADVSHRKVVANIPYYLTTDIILKLLNEAQIKTQPLTPDIPWFSDIFLMVQWEVAERLLSQPGQKSYNLSRLMVEYAAELVHVELIDRACFFPVPKVDSALIHLRPRTQTQVQVKEVRCFWHLVQAIFQYRRKTLRNVLRHMGYNEARLTQWATQIDLSIRGEKLTLTGLADLANMLHTCTQG